MTTRLLALAVLGAVALGGCRASTAFPYEACAYDSDCRVGSDLCVTFVRNGASVRLCSSSCAIGVACPSDRYGTVGSCISTDSGSSFHCYQSCTPGSTLCEYGTTCNTITGTSTSVCEPGGGTSNPGTVPSYGSCTTSADCANLADRCIEVIHAGASRFICSSPCTSAGGTCPRDSTGTAGSCVSFDSGSTFNCYQMCSPGSSVCGAGASCVTESGGGNTTNICLPGTAPTTVPAYAGCAGGMTCQSGTQCIGVKDAHTLDLCTVAHCTSDNDCPQDRRGGLGACVSLDGDSFGTCVERCNTTSDCTYGSMGAERCTTHTAMGVTLPPPGVCLPT